MQNPFAQCTETHRMDAIAELRAELAEFNHDGLVQLIEDLKSGIVVRGSWTGCVISYKRGAAGSARRDRHGRARNGFTILWDKGWITDEEVIALAQHEIRQRTIVGDPVLAVVQNRECAGAGAMRESAPARIDRLQKTS